MGTSPPSPDSPQDPHASQPKHQTPQRASAKKGRPRDQDAYQSILKATRRIASEKASYKDVSIEAIANEAQASKATIYRWWESKALLLREACWMDGFEPVQEKDLESDMIRMIMDEVRVQTEFMNGPTYAGTIAELIDMSAKPNIDPDLTLCPYEVETRARIQAVFHRARARGDWEGPAELDMIYDVLFGTVFAFCTAHGKTFSSKHVTKLAKMLLLVAVPTE